MDDIHRILDVIATSKKAKVLATIIKTEGSAYKKEGASMLILEDKTRVGMLSAAVVWKKISLKGQSRSGLRENR